MELDLLLLPLLTAFMMLLLLELLLLLLVLLAENMMVTVKRYMVEQKKWCQVARKFNIWFIHAPGWCLAKQNLFSAQTCTLFLWKWGSMRLECSEKYKSELLL